MKILLIAALVAVCAATAAWLLSRGGDKPAGAKSRASIYDYSYTSIEGATVPLSAYRGKYILFVNVASQCGFTPQYAELEKLSAGRKEDLVVIGFPANDFLGQEPGTDEEIKTFCTTRYGVTFPLSQKISVVGDGKSDIYRWLTDKDLNGWNDKEPKWNFYKYLVGRDGELLKVLPSSTTPLSPELTEALR
jgi:glutathione peroxidase